MSATELRPGIWGRLAEHIESAPAPEEDGQVDVWEHLATLVDPGEFRPKLADDIEVKEFHLRWGNDYAMIANPRDLIHYELEPNQVKLLKLMDGTRTVKEIVLDGLKESGELELGGVADLVEQLYMGNFLDKRFDDVEEAVERAINPVSVRRQKARQFARTLSIEWKGADRLVRTMYKGGLKYAFTLPAFLVASAVVVVGFLAFLRDVHTRRFGLSGQSLALGFLVLTVLNYFLTFVHELGHAAVLVHFGRRVKSAGFMVYFGSPAFFIESADGLMLERRQRMLQAFAGGFGEMIFCGIASLVIWAFPGFFLAPTLYKFAVLGYLVIFLNWVPLLELDGYFLLADLIQVPDLRPRAMAFIRHDLWHKLRRRRRFTKQEVGLALYGIVGVVFSVYVLYLSVHIWHEIFGSLVSRLWHGGPVARFLLAALALFVLGPVIRGAINLVRSITRRLRAVWSQLKFRLETSWRVEAAKLIDALPMFDDVPEDVLSELAGQVGLRTLSRGQPVVRQGERAEAFYVVRRGTLEVVEADPESGNERQLRVLGKGEAFGELGLVEGAPRTATVRALEEAEVFEIGKGTFQRLLASMIHVPKFAPSFQEMGELRELSAFSHLEADELSELLDHGEWVNFAPGGTVIEQGEVGDAFYAIKSGQVEVFEDGAFKRNMGPGSHFGEIALLLDVPRTATVVARTPVRAFRLDREGFDKLVVQAFRGGTLNPIISPDRIQKH